MNKYENRIRYHELWAAAGPGSQPCDDPEFLEYWKVADSDDWYKKHNPGKKYYLDNDIATWKDVVDDCLHCNSIMHEG